MTTGPVFDAHLHIVDPRFPLVPNQGFVPDPFTVDDYAEATADLPVVGGAVVSGSFQRFDQSYLLDALQRLGPSFVGVTQLPTAVSDERIRQLNRAGVRAVRFNLYRGLAPSVDELRRFARRVHDIAGWHVELYVDGSDLSSLYETIVACPTVVIDHLGRSVEGHSALLRLVRHSVYVKASGFGRLDFDPVPLIKTIAQANPGALLFGTDLPSTRAPRPFRPQDVDRMAQALDASDLRKALYENAVALYRPRQSSLAAEDARPS